MKKSTASDTAPVIVQSVEPRDYEDLAAFLAQFGDETRNIDFWEARLRSWWDENPSFLDPLERGWILRHGMQIVGFWGGIPSKFLINGEESTVFGGTTWRVLPEFRRRSMLLYGRKMQAHKDALFFSTTASQLVTKLHTLRGYQPICGVQGTSERSIVVLDYGKLIQQRFQGIGGRILASFLRPLLAPYRNLQLRRLNPRGIEVRKLSKADSRFDELWERTKNQYLHTNVRDAKSVNWYCFAGPFKKVLLGCFIKERLVGFIILMPDETSAGLLNCMDLWLDPEENEREVVGALIAKAAQTAREKSMDRMWIPHFNQHLAEILGDLRLPMRPMGGTGFFNGPKEMLSKIISDNSYFVTAQGDQGL